MFCVGDKIVHPMHGAGVIESIVDEKIGRDLVRFYVFRMPVSGLTLKIPTANSEMIGVRAVSSAETIERVLAEHGLDPARVRAYACGNDGMVAACRTALAAAGRAWLRVLADGVDAAEVTAMLASDRFAAEVRADQRLARELGISGVPFFVFDQRLAVSGAQPVEALVGALVRKFNHDPIMFLKRGSMSQEGNGPRISITRRIFNLDKTGCPYSSEDN